MKKEFKAPIVETKNLSTLNGIMDMAGVLSTTSTPTGKLITDTTTVEGYNRWKGFSN